MIWYTVSCGIFLKRTDETLSKYNGWQTRNANAVINCKFCTFRDFICWTMSNDVLMSGIWDFNLLHKIYTWRHLFDNFTNTIITIHKLPLPFTPGLKLTCFINPTTNFLSPQDCSQRRTWTGFSVLISFCFSSFTLFVRTVLWLYSIDYADYPSACQHKINISCCIVLHRVSEKSSHLWTVRNSVKS